MRVVMRCTYALVGALLLLSFSRVATPLTVSVWPEPTLTRITGADLEPCQRWYVCGTDLGIAYELPNGSVGYVFGDTFDVAWPEHGRKDGWRSPVILRSASNPATEVIAFDNAAGSASNAMAPGVTRNGHFSSGEVTVIPNDIVSLPDGRHVMSLQSVSAWLPGTWRTNYSELAVSHNNGNSFKRTGVRWSNPTDTDTMQMVSMQLDGDYVYMIGVQAGRVEGSMQLMRVPWQEIFNKTAYRCWNGSLWAIHCEGILSGRFGEPSLRKLRDGTWAMAYLDIHQHAIVTRWASHPTGQWSKPKIQLTAGELSSLYGGFIHPYSTTDQLTLLVSSWQRPGNGSTIRYDVSQLSGLSIHNLERG